MNTIDIGNKKVPKVTKEENANFAVLEIGDSRIFIEKSEENEDKELIEITNDWMVKNNVSWNMVESYAEKQLDPQEVAREAMTQGLPQIEIMYHNDDLKHVELNEKGNFLDLRAAEDVSIKAGEWKLIDLGVSIKLPQGFWGQLVPRSSLFKNHGLLVANSFGVIDSSYCGEDDHWMLSVYATRDTEVKFNERIAQFRIVRDIPFVVFETDHLDDPSRGGFGSTGVE